MAHQKVIFNFINNTFFELPKDVSANPPEWYEF